MDVKLKQRVIGAIVLTTLAIIVVPMILDGSSREREKVIARVPEPPAIELEKLRVDEVRRQMKAVEAESAARLPQHAADDDEPESAPAPDTTQAAEPGEGEETGAAFELDENKLPVAWALQVASFRDQEKATALRASLRESNYRTYIIRAETSEGPTYRVLIGPMNQKQKLQAISNEIQSSFNLEGFIVRYRVEDDQGQLGG